MVYSMTKDKSIYIKNIYYMLSYAFQVLKQSNYESVESEDFENIQDLFAAILAKGVSQQLKRGMYKEYRTQNEERTVLRGKLDMSGTIRRRMQHKQLLSCEFDELSENNMFNQILKTTMVCLIKDEGVKEERKHTLSKNLLFFNDIDLLQPSKIRWNRLQYQRNNRNYEMLLNVCYFVIDGMLQTTEKGKYKMAAFKDEHMATLYEKFILEYYRQNHPYLDEIKSAYIKWNLSQAPEEKMIRFLPAMKSDVFLRYKDRILIIDAKYYSKSMQQNYDKKTIHSGNLYQIFTYVKNQDSMNTGKVSGLLLYAKTDESITPDCMYDMSGNRIGARTLDLGVDFNVIAGQLDSIVDIVMMNNELKMHV